MARNAQPGHSRNASGTAHLHAALEPPPLPRQPTAMTADDNDSEDFELIWKVV